VRRLLIPHYEEARQYFATAQTEGYLHENDIYVFSQDVLTDLIEKYGSELC
jgi:hypothetical protein